MAGISLEYANVQLAIWMAANTSVAAGQSYEIETGTGRRKLTMVDAAEIRNQITFWNNHVNRLSAVGGFRRRTRYVVPD